QLYLTDPHGKKDNVVYLSKKDISTDNYSFIEIDKPTPGKWILSGPIQEIERATILTDVNLVTQFLSGVYFQEEIITLKSHLAQKKDLITAPIIVDSLQMTMKLQSDENNYLYQIPYKGNGQFKITWRIDIPAAFYRLILAA